MRILHAWLWCFPLVQDIPLDASPYRSRIKVKDKGPSIVIKIVNSVDLWHSEVLKDLGYVAIYMIIFRSLKGFGVCWHMIIFKSLRGSGVLPAVFKVAGSLGFIGFDTSYIVGGTLHQSFYQLVGLSLNHQKTTNIINKILYHLNKW